MFRFLSNFSAVLVAEIFNVSARKTCFVYQIYDTLNGNMYWPEDRVLATGQMSSIISILERPLYLFSFGNISDVYEISMEFL